MVAEMMLFSERGSVQGRGCHRGIHYDKQFFALCTTFMEVTDSGLPWEAEGLYIDYASLSKGYGLLMDQRYIDVTRPKLSTNDAVLLLADG